MVPLGEYDPLGNCLEKRDYLLHDTLPDTTSCSRDAQGNILAIYSRKQDTMKLNEWDIYGSKRIGTVDTNLVVYSPPQPPSTYFFEISPIDSITFSYLENQKQYELTNHLGNVLVTVSDRKYAIDPSHSGFAEYYLPNIVNAQDYYPFGMVEPGRNYTGYKDSAYRFDFNGMEKDNKVYGNWNAYTTEFRELDPRLGRWWSADPKVKTWESPYLSMADNPVWKNDILGDLDDYYYNKEGKKVDYNKNNQPDIFYIQDATGNINHKGAKYSPIDLKGEIGTLARVTYAEAGGENQVSKEAVADVVKNRVESSKFPNSYHEVVEQKTTTKRGINIYQFSSVNPQSINNWKYSAPTSTKITTEKIAFANSISAAIKVHNGFGGSTNGALFYYSPKSMTPKLSEPNWVSKGNLQETFPSGVDQNNFRFFK